MRDMIDSRVEWIGSIPASWQTLTIGSLFKVRNEKVNDTDYPPLSVTKGGIVPQMENVAKSDANDNRKMVLTNDFVINSRSDRKQSCGVSSLDGSVSLINTVLYPAKDAPIVPAYLNYLLKNYGFAEEFYRWGHGIVADLWTTRWQEMKSILLPMPSMEEQQQILDTISDQTDKVDALIGNVQAQIEKLKAYKTSIITEAVTLGLNLSVSYKDSGLQWVPEIPDTWDNRKMITILSMRVVDGPHESPVLHNEGIPYISATAIENGKINFDLMRGYISEEYCNLCDIRYKPQLHDILVIKLGASTGQVAIVETENRFNIWVPLAAVRCNDEADPYFVYYAFQSDYFKRQMELSWTYGTQQTLGVKTIERLRILLPPLEEQKEIVAYLNDKRDRIDRLIAIKQAKIEKLEQYKRSLIYEYVTGKKEVQ